MILSAIAAVGPNGELGLGGGLPWPRLRPDLGFFRKTTGASPLVMGRRTWESLPDGSRPLPGRASFILSRDPGWYPDYSLPEGREDETSVDLIRDPAEFLAFCEQWGGDEAFVIGGRQVYEAFWDRLDRIYVTKVDLEGLRADTFFPQYPPSSSLWEERPLYDRFFVDGKTKTRMGFYVYERKRMPIPPMPPVNAPREAHPTNYCGQVIEGYVESLQAQAENNWPALEWFFRNHREIAAAVRLYNAARLESESGRPPAE